MTFRNHLDSSTGKLRIGPGNNGAIDQGVSQRARYAADIRARYVRILSSSPDIMVLDWEISQRSPTSSGSDITNYVNGSRTRYIYIYNCSRLIFDRGGELTEQPFLVIDDKVNSSAQAGPKRYHCQNMSNWVGLKILFPLVFPLCWPSEGCACWRFVRAEKVKRNSLENLNI